MKMVMKMVVLMNNLCFLCVFQLEVLQESKMMIPDCHRRLTIAHADLSQILVSTALLGRETLRNQTHPPFFLAADLSMILFLASMLVCVSV